MVAAAAVFVAIGGSAGLWLLALHLHNARLEIVLLFVDALLVGGLACAPTGTYLMRAGRGGAASPLPDDPTQSETERIERLAR